ncbi:acyl-CoA dehydratase activase [Deltaproteobacteria bacterium TL4]
MPFHSHILGIDIGSVSVAVVEIDANKEVLHSAYLFHHGSLLETVTKLLSDFDLTRISAIASTSSTPSSIQAKKKYDNQIAIITAAKHFHEKTGSILVVGGEKFGLILFDEKGNYLNNKTNTSCAAGTGSFLDQQVGRLNLSGIEELSNLAMNSHGEIPKIASRCAVFAKTDLIHAQQEGYTLGQISDGLCYGLAKNIVDTLFKGIKPNTPLLFCGGGSKKKAGVKHLSALIGNELMVDENSHLYGAIGAALNLIAEGFQEEGLKINSIAEIILKKKKEEKFYYEPLKLKLSNYPDFISVEKYEYPFKRARISNLVEVDLYEKFKPFDTIEGYLGLDIGSTSTKAVIIDRDHTVLAGFYTRTSGRPVEAIQAIFEAIDDFIKTKQLELQIIGTGTTGSGRKFIGKIIGADLVINEITAHARAAYALNPEVDTIIEIGGQDSKFTTLKKGMVTSSTMNNVCAAGTGSFIEEQAQKLGCSLADYSRRTESRKAPMSSDRCTVFMERDLNHYLSEGYSIDEVLASVLHSVRENYLSKVATEANIGNTVLFQGATAKNKALVAAFEQRLGKPILVSKYCHLTGALGTALTLSDERVFSTTFKGLELYKQEIPIRSEVCELCTNHCKIAIADLGSESVAFGFLCGRDYETKKYVNKNTSGFDLIKERKKAVFFLSKKEAKENITIGIPAGLYLFEDLPFWRNFFDLLSIKTITSENYKHVVKEGKSIAGAEFCAPMMAMYGHVKFLLDKADYIFLPYYLENKEKEKGIRRQYCYYTQFMPSLVSGIADREHSRFLMPTVKYLYNVYYTKVQLYKMLKSISEDVNLFEVSSAYDKALESKNACSTKIKNSYASELSKANDICVMFVGRPYSVLSSSMNNKIPDIFAALGIKTFFQDMLSYSKDEVALIKPLLDELHWEYASKILEVSEVIAKTERVYPVLITSFKCSPDSFITEYFKDLMDSHEKPYLILQLDEHDSSVGYETRIEAAIRSFRNHDSLKKTLQSQGSPIIKPEVEKKLVGKTIVLPNWDSITCNFLVANLKREGFEARLLEETESSIKKSLKYNTGQCIPLNIIAQEYIECIEKNKLDPEKTVLFLNDSEISCNIRLYPYHIQRILRLYGKGFEKAAVYSGELSFVGISLKAAMNAYFAYMFGGLLRKMACKIRPYETEKGTTDKVLQKSIKILSEAFLDKRTKEDAVAQVVAQFEWIDTKEAKRPKVALFGDLYVRDNEVMNQDLIHFIEENGGEVITTPFNDYAKIVAGSYFRKWFIEGKYFDMLSSKTIMATMNQLEKTYNKYFERILGELDFKYDELPEKILAEYNMTVDQTGESTDNILKIFYIKKQYPDVSLFIQLSPSFCCPSLITEAMSKEIEKNTGVPVVSVTYDGTGGNKNEVIIPYLKYPKAHVVV